MTKVQMFHGSLLLLLVLAVPGHAQRQAEPPIVDGAGAALALPFFADQVRSTTLGITNLGDSDRILRLTIIDGSDWGSRVYTCQVTAKEVSFFDLFVTPLGARIVGECATSTNRDARLSRAIPSNQGVVFVSLLDPESNQTSLDNVLIGEAIVDSTIAGTSWSVEAIPFRGLDPFAPGAGDREFRFDGVEYEVPPARIGGHFFAPSATGNVSARLLLFSLDGGAGFDPPTSRVNIVFWDDDEVARTTEHTFDCFDFVRLEDIDERFLRNTLGSNVGHLTITPQTVAQNDPGHDSKFDGGDGDDGMRRTPVLGWIVHSVGNASLVAGAPSMAGEDTFARRLEASRDPLAPAPGDTPTLSAPLVLVAQALAQQNIFVLRRLVEADAVTGNPRFGRIGSRFALRAFEFATELVSTFVEEGRTRPACRLIRFTRLRSDGRRAPIDWIVGDVVPDFNDSIADLSDLVGCETRGARRW